MPLFRKHSRQPTVQPWDKEQMTPVIRCSICTGEQVAGFRNRTTGKMEEVMLLRDEADLQTFKSRYGITGDIEKIY